jgi:hypothetical protein
MYLLKFTSRDGRFLPAVKLKLLTNHIVLLGVRRFPGRIRSLGSSCTPAPVRKIDRPARSRLHATALEPLLRDAYLYNTYSYS